MFYSAVLHLVLDCLFFGNNAIEECFLHVIIRDSGIPFKAPLFDSLLRILFPLTAILDKVIDSIGLCDFVVNILLAKVIINNTHINFHGPIIDVATGLRSIKTAMQNQVAGCLVRSDLTLDEPVTNYRTDCALVSVFILVGTLQPLNVGCVTGNKCIKQLILFLFLRKPAKHRDCSGDIALQNISQAADGGCSSAKVC